MTLWLGLVGGLIIGWVLEWLIDWRFWRRSYLSALASERRWRNEAQAAQRTISQMQAAMAEVTWPAKEALAAIVVRDPLEEIGGISPVFAQRLHDAGIFTYEQLGSAPLERVVTAVQAEAWQAGEVKSWIEQARQLARQPI